MSTATAKRRRRQARNGYRHLAPLVRPRYAWCDTESATRREAMIAAKRRELMARGVKVR